MSIIVRRTPATASGSIYPSMRMAPAGDERHREPIKNDRPMSTQRMRQRFCIEKGCRSHPTGWAFRPGPWGAQPRSASAGGSRRSSTLLQSRARGAPHRTRGPRAPAPRAEEGAARATPTATETRHRIPRHVFRTWDPAQYEPYLTDDPVYHVGRRRAPGPGRLAQVTRYGAELYPNGTNPEIEAMVAEGDSVAVRLVMRAVTNKGEDYENTYLLWFDLEDGRIARAVGDPRLPVRGREVPAAPHPADE